MFIAEIIFNSEYKKTTDEQEEEVNTFLGILRMDGRILGNELLTIQENGFFKCFAAVPAKDAFKKLDESIYLKKSLKKLDNLKFDKPTLKILGKEISEDISCNCKNSSAYILFTNYVSIQSPLNCFDCFSPVPLYRIPRFEAGDYHPIISWQSDYKSCDRLQMNCTTGERFAMNQMSRLDSSLSKQGLKICSEIKTSTNKNCYYYLYKYTGKSKKKELERKCPSCNGEWLLKEDFFKFDFKCDKCHLLSNIAYSIY
jgi:predicted  nucleic acid-binding Zn ribbon protein